MIKKDIVFDMESLGLDIESSLDGNTPNYKRSSIINNSLKKTLNKEFDKMVDFTTEKTETMNALSVKITNTERTYIYILITNKENEEHNRRLSIRCNSSKPFGNYAYDVNNDSCYVEGIDLANIGHINIGGFISMDKTGNWNIRIPLPESVIDKHLSIDQKKALKSFLAKYNAEKFIVHYIQLGGCN